MFASIVWLRIIQTWNNKKLYKSVQGSWLVENYMFDQFWMKFLSHRTNTCTVNSLQWNSIRHSLCFLTSAENNTPPHLRAIRVETCLRLGIWLQIIFKESQSHFHFWSQSDVLAIYIHTHLPTWNHIFPKIHIYIHTFKKHIYIYLPDIYIFTFCIYQFSNWKHRCAFSWQTPDQVPPSEMAQYPETQDPSKSQGQNP